MGNGHDKNWVRLRAAVDGFYVRHRRWPTRIRMDPAAIDDLRHHVFSRAAYASILTKLQLLADDASFVAEDGSGASYNYGEDGFPETRPQPDAAEWLGVKPKPAEY